jgi:hypothetical protein
VLLQAQILLQKRGSLKGVVVLDGAHGADGVVIVIRRGTIAQTSYITRQLQPNAVKWVHIYKPRRI